MNPLKKIAVIAVGSLSFFAFARVQAQSIFDATGGSSWMKATGATSASGTNWTSNGSYSNPPGPDDIAEFGGDFVEGGSPVSAIAPFGPNLHGSYGTTDLAGSGTSLGLAAASGGATDANTEAVGAISLTGVPAADFYIGNGYNSATSGYNTFLELNGASVNGTPDTVISNTGSETLTIEAAYAGQGSTLGLVLGNTSNVIETGGSSTTVISSNIYEVNASSAVTVTGGGALILSGANQYSGGTTVGAGSLSVGSTTGLGTGAVAVVGGTLGATVANVSIGGTLSLTSGSIALSAGSSPTLQLALNQNFTMAGGTLSLASGSGGLGSIASLGGSGAFTISGGTLDLNNSISNYSQSYDLLTGFAAGSSSVDNLTIDDYDSAAYTASLSDAGVLSFTPVATPEPSTWAMIAGAVAWLAMGRRRRAGCLDFPALLLGFFRRRRAFGAAVFALGLAGGISGAGAQELISGDLVVSTYGSTTSSTLQDGQPTPITLEEFALPTATSATYVTSDTLSGIVGEYGSSSEGTIELTGNGEYLTIGGYAEADDEVGAPTGGYSVADGTALAQATSANVPRVADLIDSSGEVVSSTFFSDIYTTNNIRSVYSEDGSSFYVSGQGDKTTAEQGIFYAPSGTSYSSSETTQGIYNTNDTRTVEGYAGNLYYSLDKKNTGIYEYSGLPTTSQGTAGTQITTATNGQTGSAQVNYSPEGFYFANATTLYVADTGVPKSGTVGDGGIQKWTLSGGTWTLQYTLSDPNFVAPGAAVTATSGQTGFEALTGQVIGGTVYLYAISYTAGDGDANGLYEISDSLTATTTTGQSFDELASAAGIDGTGSDDVFKGVSFAPEAVPEPSSWAMIVGALALLVLVKRRSLGRR